MGVCRRGSLRATQPRAGEARLSHGVRVPTLSPAVESLPRWPAARPGSRRSRAPGPRPAPALGGRRSRPGPAAHLRQPRGAPGPRPPLGERPARGQQRHQQHQAEEEPRAVGQPRHGLAPRAAPHRPSAPRERLPRVRPFAPRLSSCWWSGSAQIAGARWCRAFLGSAPGTSAALPTRAAPRRTWTVSAGGRLPLVLPPPALRTRRCCRPSPRRIPGGGTSRRARRSARSSPARPLVRVAHRRARRRHRDTRTAWAGGAATRRSPARAPSALGQVFIYTPRSVCSGRKARKSFPQGFPAPLLEEPPRETPAAVRPMSSGCSQSASKTQRDLRLKCDDKSQKDSQQLDTSEVVVRRWCHATGCHLV